jgi:hypothetical protein
MTPLNLHTLNSSLLALPVAVVFTRKLLLNHKASATVESISLNDKISFIEKRANKLTKTLKDIMGYDHHGLNE